MMNRKNVNLYLKTNGRGLWSAKAASVLVEFCEMVPLDDEFGELRVYFDTKTWPVDEFGLIYTDPMFLKELKAYFFNEGIDAKRIDYSEQGMQGDNYVSLDVDKEFIASWK